MLTIDTLITAGLSLICIGGGPLTVWLGTRVAGEWRGITGAMAGMFIGILGVVLAIIGISIASGGIGS